MIPLSPTRRVGGLVVVSGQIGRAAGALAGPGVREQTEQALHNLATALATEGLTLADVVKTTVFLTDMRDYQQFNDAYRRFFTAPFPARSVVAVVRLPVEGACVEIEALATAATHPAAP
ncbi:RidA family protein [Streptomyces sparsogenes]|uniref:RidA family protein n=1 Tax=Streptomyces sparsogenes TaxID=67365 RepID=UPI00332CD7F9